MCVYMYIMNIGNLDVASPDSKEVLESMDCGQRCLLKGLISMQRHTVSLSRMYTRMQKLKAGDAYSKAKNLRTSLRKLFNQRSRSVDLDGSQSADVLLPNFPTPQQRKRSCKGKLPATGPVKKKVKEIRVHVAALAVASSHTPVGSRRDLLTKSIWIRETASAEEVESKIREAFGWKPI